MIELRRWTDDDEPLLHATVGDAALMAWRIDLVAHRPSATDVVGS